MTDRDELHQLTGAYALNALTPSERAAFEEHLEQSDDAAREVDEMTETAALLAFSATPVQPPADMRARLMAAIATTPQLAAPATADVATGAASISSTPPALHAVRQDAEPTEAQRRAIDTVANGGGVNGSGSAAATARSRWFSKPVMVLAGAAAAAGLFFGGSLLGVSISDSSEVENQAASLAEITAADDVQRQVAEVAGGGTATLIFSPELDRSAVLIDGLPALGSDEIYELWYIDDDGARPAGTFNAAETGQTWRVLDGDMAENDVIGITVEPAGGSEAPTTDPIVVLGDA